MKELKIKGEGNGKGVGLYQGRRRTVIEGHYLGKFEI